MATTVIALPIILVLVILLIVGIARAGKKALILIPIVVLGVVFFPFISYQRVSSVSHSFLPGDALQQDMQEQSAIWSDALEDYLEADQYACMADGAEYLGNHLAGHYKGTDRANRMVVYGQNPVTTSALNAFADRLRTQLDLAEVRVESYKPSVLPDEPNLIVCVLDVPTQDHGGGHQVNGLPINHNSGILRLHVEGRTNTGHSVRFLDKGWLKTLSDLHSSGHTSVAVARSSGSCTDETEARQQAMQRAASMVEDLLKQANEDYTILDREINLTPQDLQAHQLVADEFSQSLRTSGARVWRHAVLLNLRPQVMGNLLQQKRRQIQRVHGSWAKHIMSLAGLALVVFILYIFLNAATKGYYAWSLRVIALITIVGGVVVVMLLV